MAEPITVCANCGVIAPSMVDKCDACAQPLTDETRRIIERGERLWVQVRAQYQCTRCNKRSPIDLIDVGRRTCLKCRRDQDVDPKTWAKGLRFCHEIGDLAGPDPEGQHPDDEVSIGKLNDWADVGVTRSLAKLDYAETIIDEEDVRYESLFLQVRPGVPLCAGCDAKPPLDVAIDERGHISMRCPSCEDAAQYAVQPGVLRANQALVGVVGERHRVGEQADRNAEEVAPFWMAFEGASAARRKLEKKAGKKKSKAGAPIATAPKQTPSVDEELPAALTSDTTRNAIRLVALILFLVGVYFILQR